MIYQFNEHELDEQIYELRHADQTVKIEPKVFDVLTHLIRNRDRVVTKEELRATLWAGEFVTNDALVRCIVEARKAVQDDGDRQDVIKTFRSRGYQFVAAVRERQASGNTQAAFRGPHTAQAESLIPISHQQTDVFAGRQVEIQALRACLQDARQGHGQLVLISGEAGIGKTRLANEIVAYARHQEVYVLRGHCYDSDNAPDFWLWRQLIQMYAQDCKASTLRDVMGAGIGDLAAVAPMVRQVIPTLPPPLNSDPNQTRFRFFDSFATFIKNVANKQPLLIVLDDLQWADSASFQLLQFLVYELRERRVLLLCTCRDNGLGRRHPLNQALGELARSEIYQRLTLYGLSTQEIATYLAQVTGRPQPTALAALIQQKTEGNPFFVKELVRALTKHHQAADTDSSTGWQLPVPHTVEETIGRQLATLSSTCARVLAIAAVIGRTFDLPLLTQLIDLTDVALMAVLEEALNARIIEEVRGSVCQYRFTKALVHDHLYDSLIAIRRVDLHRQIGMWLETRYSTDLNSHLHTLAHHFCKAAAGGDAQIVQKAIDYAFQVDQQDVIPEREPDEHAHTSSAESH